ncbi:hypothetical protein AMK26_07010 [Streptomyces sp. CB03234]|nr:hypothetical protein AMK26_07010 [Streptomyces sp. CB03234]
MIASGTSDRTVIVQIAAARTTYRVLPLGAGAVRMGGAFLAGYAVDGTSLWWAAVAPHGRKYSRTASDRNRVYRRALESGAFTEVSVTGSPRVLLRLARRNHPTAPVGVWAALSPSVAGSGVPSRALPSVASLRDGLRPPLTGRLRPPFPTRRAARGNGPRRDAPFPMPFVAVRRAPQGARQWNGAALLG